MRRPLYYSSLDYTHHFHFFSTHRENYEWFELVYMLRRIALTLASIILVGEANEYYELYGLLPSPTDPPLRFYTHGRIIVNATSQECLHHLSPVPHTALFHNTISCAPMALSVAPTITRSPLTPHLLPFLPLPPPTILSAAINAILFFSAILHCRWQPFKDPVHNHIESLSVVLLFALYDTEMIVKITPGSNEKMMSKVLDVAEVTGMCLLVPFLIRDVRTRIVSILRKAPCCSKRKKRSRVSYGSGGPNGRNRCVQR